MKSVRLTKQRSTTSLNNFTIFVQNICLGFIFVFARATFSYFKELFLYPSLHRTAPTPYVQHTAFSFPKNILWKIMVTLDQVVLIKIASVSVSCLLASIWRVRNPPLPLPPRQFPVCERKTIGLLPGYISPPFQSMLETGVLYVVCFDFSNVLRDAIKITRCITWRSQGNAAHHVFHKINTG